MTELTALPLIDAAVRGAAVTLLLLTALSLSRLPVPAAALGPGRLLALGMAVQVAAGLPWLTHTWTLHAQAPLIAISVGNGALFWLTVRALFDDGFQPTRRDALPWMTAVIASLAACLLPPAPWPSVWSVAAALQQAAPLVFALLALVAVVRQWDADLVEARRRLRAFLAVSGVAYTLTMIAVRVVGGPRLGPVSALGDALAVLAMVVPLVVWALRRVPEADDAARGTEAVSPGGGRFDADAADASVTADASSLATSSHATSVQGPDVAGPSVPGPSTPSTAADAPDPADDRLAVALARAMDEDQAWRDEGLTIGRLADRLDAPEYRLRRVINRRLGHRNFNAFVNGYRLAEACRALADPARRDEPVLTIALDAGFQSIGPFNRAFRLATGVTPTEYRRARTG